MRPIMPAPRGAHQAAAALAKAKREQARTMVGIVARCGAESDDYVPLRLRSKGQASGGVEAGGIRPRGAVPHGLALAGDEGQERRSG